MKQVTPLAQDFHMPSGNVLEAAYLTESHLLNLLPAGVYVCDRNGFIKAFNQKATALWGRAPNKGGKEEMFSGAYQMFHPNGSPVAPSDSPVAACIKTGQGREHIQLILERPDHSSIKVMVNVVPIKDEQQNLIGVMNCFYEVEPTLQDAAPDLNDFVNNAPIGMHLVDKNGFIKWANQAELDLLGYHWKEYIGHHISEFHADKSRIADMELRLTNGETLQSYESDMLCKDGSVKTMQISSNVFWENGAFIHTRCFSIDITEQKKLQKELRQNEGRYQQLIESLHTPLYTTDVSGRIMLFNKAAAELWGREPEIGKELWCGSYKIFQPDGKVLPAEDCPMAVCLREQRPVLGEEILVQRPDGTVRNVAPHPQPIFDDAGNMTGAINMLLDITDFKRTEQALRESEKQYRDLAEQLEKSVEATSSDLIRKNEELKKSEERYHKMVEEVEDYAIILLDKNGVIQNWNRGAEKIKGYTEKEILGKHFEIFYLPEDRASLLPYFLINQAASKGKAIHEGWRVRKDGTPFWGSVVLTALHDASRQVIGYTKVTRDLTAKKLAEDKMKDYTDQLRFQNQELEQFAYAASHDMKEPLRKIHLYTSSVLDNPKNIFDPKSKEYLARTVNAAKRMNNLIEDLLRYSRTTANEESFEEVDLQEIIEDIKQLHKDEFEASNARIEYRKIPKMRGIPFQMRQLMDNLITNSLKYRHPDRPAEIRITHKIVTDPTIKEGDHQRLFHCISVTDNGIGFDQQHAEKVFDIFQRLHNEGGTRGSGIGLAICKKIIQNHKGMIMASGVADEGARFDIYLPLNPD